MKTTEFLNLLRRHPDHNIGFVLPDGSRVPPHFHITEVGHLSKTFLDCGGRRHSAESCLLQLWLADDTDHRLVASKLSGIFDRADGLLPSVELPVEIEHEAPVLTQLTITRHAVGEKTLEFHLEHKRTDCLAKDICLPDFSLPAIPGQSTCNSASGCC